MLSKGRPMSGVELLKEYIDSKDLERGTVLWLTLIVGRFARHNGGVLTAADFCREKVGAWLTSMVDSRQLSRTTIKSYRRGLLILWRWGYNQGHLPYPPLDVKPIKAPAPVPHGWNALEASRFLTHAAFLAGSYKCGIPRALFFVALIRVAWDTGLRLGDLLRLTTLDYDTDGHGAIVQHKTGRVVFFRLRPETLAAIEAIRPRSRPAIFGGVVSRAKLFRAARRMATAAGLVGGLRQLRKGGASEIERLYPGRGHRYLGHTGRQIAEKHYFDPRIISREVLLPPPLIDPSGGENT